MSVRQSVPDYCMIVNRLFLKASEPQPSAERKTVQLSVQPDQAGELQFSEWKSWTDGDFYADGKCPEGFRASVEDGTQLLDRAGKKLRGTPYPQLDFCEDPQAFWVLREMGEEAGLEVYYDTYYIADTDGIWHISSLDLGENPEAYRKIAYPAGMTADDVREIIVEYTGYGAHIPVPVLISDRFGNFILNDDKTAWVPTYRGYSVKREDGQWIISRGNTDAVLNWDYDENQILDCSMSDAYFNLVLCGVDREAKKGSLVIFYGHLVGQAEALDVYTADIDMSDWVVIPKHIVGGHPGYYILETKPTGPVIRQFSRPVGNK